MEQSASAREFVVQVPPTESKTAGSGLHAVDVKLELDDLGSLVIEVRNPSKDAKATWKQLLDDAVDALWAAPVLVDKGGAPHYPTGDVTVRLRSALSDDELKEFAANHDLELRARNEFVPEQASFRPANLRGTYLPDLLTELEAEDNVSAAWANTRSHYQRK